MEVEQNLVDNHKISESRFYVYKDVFQSYPKNGVIKLVVNKSKKNVLFYLPHREVIQR